MESMGDFELFDGLIENDTHVPRNIMFGITSAKIPESLGLTHLVRRDSAASFPLHQPTEHGCWTLLITPSKAMAKGGFLAGL